MGIDGLGSQHSRHPRLDRGAIAARLVDVPRHSACSLEMSGPRISASLVRGDRGGGWRADAQHGLKHRRHPRLDRGSIGCRGFWRGQCVCRRIKGIRPPYQLAARCIGSPIESGMTARVHGGRSWHDGGHTAATVLKKSPHKAGIFNAQGCVGNPIRRLPASLLQVRDPST